MIVHGFACDDEGTIAEEGRVADATARAVGRERESWVGVVLVTGRTRPDL